MGEFLKSECPHCGQAIEYPAEGTGQTIPCPTCEEPFILKPVVESKPEIAKPTPAPPMPAPNVTAPVAPPPTPPIAGPIAAATPPPPMPVQTSTPAALVIKPILPAPVAPASASRPTGNHSPGAKRSSHSHAGRLDQACRDFENDREFEKLQPTREQIARAMAAANYNRTTDTEWPSHAELVAALKKNFPQFRRRPAVIKSITPDRK